MLRCQSRGESFVRVSSERLTLRIELDTGEQADAEERDDVARALRRDLLELDVERVERPVVPAPDGARAAEAIALGTLLVTLGPQALGGACSAIKEWVTRRADRRVELEIDGDRIVLDGVSDEERRQLLELFVARHRDR